MVITIWDELFFKLRVYFDLLVSSKKVFSYYSHLIERHPDVVVKFLEVQISVTFEFCLN